MANASRKIQEGLGHIKEADKHLKTSFFKWTADYDSAADQYQKAATCFKVARSYDRAKEAFMKTAECHEKNNQLFHAAKALVEAANISSDAKNYDETLNLMDRACCLYREHGTPDTACISLVHTAKTIEAAVPLKAMALYQKAADIAENDEKLREAAGHLNNAARLLIKSRKYIEAASVIKQQIEIYAKVENYPTLYNLTLGLVLVYLTEGDVVAAENGYQKAFEYQGFGMSDAAEAAEKIIEAYSNGDNDLLKSVTSKPIISCQDIEYARIGKMLQAPKGGSGLDEFAGNVGEGKESEDIAEEVKKLEINDDELEEGLC